MQVKSAIASPNPGADQAAKLPSGNLVVWGFAWSGGAAVRAVEVSTDGGTSWSRAGLESAPRPSTWVRWKYIWPASAGEHVLLSRATDENGNRQPLTRDPARFDSYELNWCAPVSCVVR